MKTISVRALALSLLIICLSAGIASAANICHVTKIEDTNDGLCSIGDCSLREAVANSTCQTIDFSLDLAGKTIGLTLGEIVIGRSLTIKGWGAEAIAISGNDLSRIFYTTSSASVVITDVTLRNGNGVGTNLSFGGGAIRADGPLTLDRVYVTASQAMQNGGAVSFGGPLSGQRLLNSTVAGNLTVNDFLDGAVTGRPVIYNSTICNNIHGGFAGPDLSFVVNSTIVNNGEKGLSMFFDALVYTANTVATDVYRWGQYSGFDSAGYNIFSRAPGSEPLFYLAQTDRVDIDPMLAPLAYNGGHTLTMAPFPGSVSIDMGSNQLAASAGLVTDQRGYIRVFDGDASGTATADNGAVEFGATPPPGIRVAGRVLGGMSGNPLRSQLVTLTDFQGHSYSTLSSSLGWYFFDNLPAGFVYRVKVSARRGPQEKTVFADQDLIDADIFIPGL